MYVIGITGPSGAGKTTALRVLESMGGQVFDCDAVYHEMLASDGELLGRIEAAFPGAVKHYALDRKALGARVFADPKGLETLTEITQPLVKQRVLERINGTDKSSMTTPLTESPSRFRHSEHSEESVSPSSVPCSPSTVPFRFTVIDAIGLFESGLAEHCDLNVAVVADEEARVRRLTARDGITEDYARARIAAQKPAEWYAERADLVLENHGSEEDFAAQCRKLFSERLPVGGPQAPSARESAPPPAAAPERGT